jgi:hypothetical protein
MRQGDEADTLARRSGKEGTLNNSGRRGSK